MTELGNAGQSPQSADSPPVQETATRRGRLFSSRDLRATTIGWEIAIPIVAGPLIGFILDRRYETGVLWTFVLLGVGLVSAIASVVKYLRYEFYMMNKEMEARQDGQTPVKWRNYDDE